MYIFAFNSFYPMQSLLTDLSRLSDTRRKAGLRHEQSVILFLFILATLQGSRGRRSIEQFIRANSEKLYAVLALSKARLPSGSTIERTLKRVDSGELGSLLSSWEQQHIDLDGVVVMGADGQCLKSTVTDYHAAGQNYVGICSFFCLLSQTVVGVKSYESKDESEIKVLQDMILASPFRRMVLMADALHCQKKL
jgi:DDE_Tnp_1-associated